MTQAPKRSFFARNTGSQTLTLLCLDKLSLELNLEMLLVLG